MNQEEFEAYLQERYQNQIDWYSTKADKNKKRYSVFQWSVIVLSATVPLLVLIVPTEAKLITAGIALLLAIGTTGLKTFKFQENWINFRTVSETLKKEKHFFDAEVDEYADCEDKIALFVTRVEAVISRENSLWVTTHQKSDTQENGKPGGYGY